jgi:hypothetical protein
MKYLQNTLLIAIIGFGLLMTSCDSDGGPIKGSGPVVVEDFDLPDVTSISLSIDADVEITYGETQEIIIEGQQNIINNIEKYVDSDGFWRISYYRSVKNHEGITIYITTPVMDYITISGSGSAETTNQFPDLGDVLLKISGSGHIEFDAKADIIEGDISGSGSIHLSGSAFEQRIGISGSGSVHAFDLITQETYIVISGSGNAEVYVEEILEVNISGSGNVYYKGNPEIDANISGSGGIINSN